MPANLIYDDQLQIQFARAADKRQQFLNVFTSQFKATLGVAAGVARVYAWVLKVSAL
jgi:hypothetical protein